MKKIQAAKEKTNLTIYTINMDNKIRDLSFFNGSWKRVILEQRLKDKYKNKLIDMCIIRKVLNSWGITKP